MKVWERRFAAFVLAGAIVLTGVPAADAAAARAERQATRRESAGILSAVLSFFHTLVEEAIAVASPAPVPHGPQTPAGTLGEIGNIGGIGDNGAGIDPNGGG